MVDSTKPAAQGKVIRRTYLVDRTFQLKYTLYMVVVGAALSLLFGAMMYQAHLESTSILELPGQDLPQALLDTVRQNDRTLLWLVGIISVVMAVALGLFGVVVTHRVAGPIYVFSHYLGVLGEGRYPMIRPLRRKDELKSFFEVLNQSVTSLKERDRTRGAALQKCAAELDAAIGRSPELATSLKPAAETLRTMGEEMLQAAATEMPATPGQKAEASSRPAA